MTANVSTSAASVLGPSATERYAADAGRAPQTFAARHQYGRRWREILLSSDVEALWRELYRLVSRHPVVRNSSNSARGKRLLFEEGKASQHSDLVQELFVILLGKNRFQHYLDSEMSDAQIEAEISQIELKNLLSAELRKRYPESYRLARRISEIIQASPRFTEFDETETRHRQKSLAERVFGLKNWPKGRARRSSSECQISVERIPRRKRDNRLVGRGGDTQLIISNADLENLIIQVFEATDSPLDVRTLRSLVMSRLPLMDIHLVSMNGGRVEEDSTFFYDYADKGENPEQRLLVSAAGTAAEGLVNAFLFSLREAVRDKPEKYQRILCVLWHSYLSSEQLTQLEVAARLGVSDSLVSDYRHRIERLLRRLPLSTLEEARMFEQALHQTVKKVIGTDACQ